MLNVALVGLLAGSLAIGGGDNKNPQSGDKPTADNAVPGIFTQSVPAPTALSPETIQDSYAFGIANRATPVRVWASYAMGETDGIWNASGDEGTPAQNLQLAGTDGEIKTTRANFGAEIGVPVSLFGFGLGIGGQITLARNSFNESDTQVATNNPPGFPAGGLLAGSNLTSGSLGPQAIKAYAIARAGALGLHGGYHFDLGDDRGYGDPQPALGGLRLPTTLASSDGRDAIFFGADFDYPSSFVRLFGGVDYYLIQADGFNDPNTAEDESLRDGDDIMNALFGAGFKLSIFELGAALQIQARLSQPLVGGLGTTEGVGASAATIAPYLRISPRVIPVSIFIKGAVQEEYTEFGYALGGSNSPRPGLGFTAGLTYGFE